MRTLSFVLLASCLAKVIHSSSANNKYNLHPFKIDLTKNVPRMLEKIRHTQIPDNPQYAAIGSTAGIDLETLNELRNQWLADFNWETEQASLNWLVTYNMNPKGLSTS